MVVKIIVLQKVILHYGKKSLFWTLIIFGYLSFTMVRGQKYRFQQLWMYKVFKHRKLPCIPCFGEMHIKLHWYKFFRSLFFIFFLLQRNFYPLRLHHQTSTIKHRYSRSSDFYRAPRRCLHSVQTLTYLRITLIGRPTGRVSKYKKWTFGRLHRRQKGGPADCTKRRSGLQKRAALQTVLFRSPVYCAACLNVHPTGPFCSAACQPARPSVQLTSPRKIHIFHLAARPSRPPFSVIAYLSFFLTANSIFRV